MSGMASYLLRLICAAFLCALVRHIGAQGPGKGMRQLLCGLFLVLTAMEPLKSMELPELDPLEFRGQAEEAVDAGLSQAEQAKAQFITDACETYILNKASEMGLDMDVEVALDEAGIPSMVTLTGVASPTERLQISDCISRELGVGKEAQVWIDPYQSGA